ncbi:hypothetical protein [Caballeronia grimmiae]|uniref:hypothetical protein n=1 Tax=Caballeronia grimmiae TaxID=1071679 RepID=UPI0038B918A6
MDASTDAKKQAAKLTAEIFSLTGQKVEIDDPLVAAAMVNASIIRQAGADAAKAIAQAAATATPRPSKSEIPKAQETTWPSRWLRLALIVAISAGIGAGIARLMPMQYGGQAADLALASAVKSQALQEGDSGALWRSLRPEVKNAAFAAMGR